MAIRLPDVVQRIVTRVDTSGLGAASGALDQLGNQMLKTGKQLSLGITLPLGVMGTQAVKAAADFEFAMTRAGVLAGVVGVEGDAAAATFSRMNDKARELGATMPFTATQAAEGMQKLAMAGLDADQVLGSIESTLTLATAGAIDLAEASDIATNIMTAFGMSVEELPRVVDELTATFAGSNTSLTQLAQGMKFVAPIASAAGISFTETSAALGLLGNAGIQATLGGTALRGSITKLLNPSDKAKEALDRLGISVTDSSGNMRSLTDIVGQFEKVGLSASDAMTIFGLRAGPGFTALVNQGSAALKEMTTELENSGAG